MLQTIRIRCSLSLLCIFLSVSSSVAAPYKGTGSKVEAFGKIMGTYSLSLSFTEVCSENPDYKKEAQETATKYLDNNQALINELHQKINQVAIENGGKNEQQKLNSDIKRSLLQLKSQTKNAAMKAITDKDSCSEILANLRNGKMDIKTKRSQEIALIMDYTAL